LLRTSTEEDIEIGGSGLKFGIARAVLLQDFETDIIAEEAPGGDLVM